MEKMKKMQEVMDLEADPFNVEKQKKIEEMINQQRIEKT